MSAKFDNADFSCARADYTGLDEHELKDGGATIDNGMTIRGFKKRVFDFMKDEDITHLLKSQYPFDISSGS